MLEKILPYIVAILVPIFTGLISYFGATKNAKSETEKIIHQYKLESKNYISKAKFDVEFELYQKLTHATVDMIFDNNALFPSGIATLPDDKEEKAAFELKNYYEACKSFDTANRLLYQNAAFTTKEIYDKFSELYLLCRSQIDDFADFKLGDLNDIEKNEYHSEIKECYKLTRTINSMISNLLDFLRSYLNSLEINMED